MPGDHPVRSRLVGRGNSIAYGSLRDYSRTSSAEVGASTQSPIETLLWCCRIGRDGIVFEILFPEIAVMVIECHPERWF